jgi:hypothetical protein
MAITDGKMQLVNGANSIELSVPGFGYRSIIGLPFDLDTLDTGMKTVYDYGTSLDKYSCEFELILTPVEQAALNDFIKNTNKSRAKACTLAMNTGSGFFPFTPLKGDAGVFTIALVITKSEKLTENPFRYFRTNIAIYNQSSFPAYTFQDQINEGSLSIGTVDNVRFPDNYFDPKEDNGILYSIPESGVLNFIDRGILASSWQTGINLSCGTGKASALLNYLVNTARANSFTLTTQPNHYAFGYDKGSSGTYNVNLIQDSIEVIHEGPNRFSIPLTVQYEG